MIELTVDNKQITVYKDEEISIEQNSPVFEDDNGTFSYPFAVPTKPNRVVLGFPGRLQREGHLAEQAFILKNNGLNVLKGGISFDEITKEDTGLILHSGKNAFNTKMAGLLLSDLNFGSEGWLPSSPTDSDIITITQRWADKNTHPKSDPMGIDDYVMAPFAVKNSSGEYVIINEHIKNSGSSTTIVPSIGAWHHFTKYYCMQFRLSWVLRKIFTSLGYSIVADEFSGHEIEKQCVLFGKIFTIYRRIVGGMDALSWIDGHGNTIIVSPATYYTNRGPIREGNVLRYGDIMPDTEVLDFIEAVRNLCGLAIYINENSSEVSFLLKNDIIGTEDKVRLSQEAEGYRHYEHEEADGYTFTFESQDDDEATLTGFETTGEVENVSDLPAVSESSSAAYLDKIFYVSAVDRYYKCTKEDNKYLWTHVARLRPVVAGGGDNQVEIGFRVAQQKIITEPANGYSIPDSNDAGSWKGSYTTYKVADLISNVELPFIDYTLDQSTGLQDMGKLIISLYHGQASPGSTYYPFICFDNYTLSSSWGMGFSLRPAYLFDQFYSIFLPWQSQTARKCVKYIKMPLHEVLQLRWDTKYIIDGVPVLLSRIAYDLPYRGIVELEGYTAY